jgi:hypothetical protein
VDIHARLERLDTELFAHIPTQTDEGDKLAWLALQRAVRRRQSVYSYLEIGSYLGGSLQPHVLDPRCVRVYSIDKRVGVAPDEREMPSHYAGNTTAHMLENLRRLAPDSLDKLVCFDADVRQIDPALICEPPHLCLIDGEHTVSAVLDDFAFSLSVASSSCIVAFHDDWVIQPALRQILSRLRQKAVKHAALKLPGCTFAIAVGDFAELAALDLQGIAVEGRRFLRNASLRSWLRKSTPKFAHPALRKALEWWRRALARRSSAQ